MLAQQADLHVVTNGDCEIADLKRFADFVAKAECERICAAIKEEDDHCWTGDYMLDSDDCIAVAKGEWKRPEYASN